MKKLSISVATGLALAVAGSATAALADGAPLVTKAPVYTAPASTSCASFYDFITTACPLTWYGVTLYGTVDMGGNYQTHGSPWDPNFPTGASYLIDPANRKALWSQGPNGLSQSNIGLKWNEPFASGWSVVGQAELAFDPYSALLANAPEAMQKAINVNPTLQENPVDSSRWGWLAGQIYTGVSSTTYGTLTFGRQNDIWNDNIVAYDPQGASYAFSPIGFSGKAAGMGDTEEARWTTAIKYRVNVPVSSAASLRFVVEGQPGLTYGAYNPNNGAIQGDIGADIKGVIPGVLSFDVSGGWIKDAVNIAPKNAVTAFPGFVGAFGPAEWLVATISNQTGFQANVKYSFGSVGYADPPILGKGPPPPAAPLVTLYAGYEWFQFSAPSDPQTSTFFDDGFLFNFNPAHITGGGATFNGTAINNIAYSANCGAPKAGVGPENCSNEIFQVMWVGAKYAITRNLDVIGAYYNYNQNQFLITSAAKGWNCTAAVAGTGLTGSSAHSQCAGTEDFWSAVLDWRFLPKWDLYIGEFFSQVNGGLANGYLARNNYSTTGGVRFRF